MFIHSTLAWISAPESDKESLFRGRAEELCKPPPLNLKIPSLHLFFSASSIITIKAKISEHPTLKIDSDHLLLGIIT